MLKEHKSIRSQKQNCPLCQQESHVFYQYKDRLYHQCKNCLGIFVDTELLPSPKEEVFRYEEHENNVEDKGYQKFVSPITKAILNKYKPKHIGLDFGGGTGPVISKVLKDHDYQIKIYDPFFHNYPELLSSKYDYIACCEVMEHFHFPEKEFDLLKNLLLENGTLYCLTDIYSEKIDFHKWYYKNDPTHVFIYQKETLEWIKENIGFSKMEINGRQISFFL